MYISKAPLQLLCDGRKFAFIYQEDDGQQFAYILESPLIKTIRCNFDDNQYFVQRMKTISFDLSLVAQDMKVVDGKNLLLDIDIFDNYTVTDLFKIINRKIDKRE